VEIHRNSGTVTHHGKMNTDLAFEPGSRVLVSVDEDRRRILSECHTAGHVVDAAMARCDQILPPLKGYHFLEGPYVEYKGSIPLEKRQTLLASLKTAFCEILEEDIPTVIATLPKDQAQAECNRLAQNFDLTDYEHDVRVVTIAGWSCPCGGTHVASTSLLKPNQWTVLGIKSKKNVVRIKYGMTPSHN